MKIALVGAGLMLLAGAAVMAMAVVGLGVGMRAASVRAEKAEQELSALSGRVAGVEEGVRVMGAEGWLKIRYRAITLGTTGNEICGEQGEVCVAVTPSETHAMNRLHTDADGDGKLDSFWGWSTFDCNSRVTRTSRCSKSKDGSKHPYMIDRSRFRKSPASKVPESTTSDILCLRTDTYEFAGCAILTNKPSN